MDYHEYKGYKLAIESYLADTAEGFNHHHYLGRCEELGFESREHEYSRLVYGNFYRAVDKKLKDIKQQLAKYLVNYAVQAVESPNIVLDTVASMINLEVNYCDNGTYQIKKGDEVLFYDDFPHILEDLTLYIFNDRK